MFIPNERADLAGIGGGCSGVIDFDSPPDPCVVDRLGGSAGVVGGGTTSTVVT